nr:MAG TPA: DNA polymerase I [Caudoviricetes sp.]
MTHHLSIDLETYSSVNLKKAGAQAYIRSPDFEILLFAYSLDGGPVQVIDMAQGEVIPTDILAALTAPEYLKHAYNAAFEWGCLSRYMGQELPPSQWRDTMLHGLYCGYTAGLEATGRALGIPEDKQKLNTGKALIRYFCVPCKPTKANGGRTRNYPHHDPDKWRLFKEYNAQDVEAEMEIARFLSTFPVPAEVQKQWETDLIINARGVAVDMDFVHGALEMGDTVRTELTDEAVKISGLYNPNSVRQLSQWLSDETGEDVSNLRKETVAEMLARDDNSAEVNRMLEIRQELGKTSTKKYDAIEEAVCADGRVRGLLQFYGANRTGRWAGRLVQVQNLPRTYTEPLELARELVKGRKLDALRVIYGSPNDTLSQLIRTAFVAAPGNVLIDADFSAIEARVISWLAGEEWRLEVFRTHGKIYEASASQMFGVPLERIKKGNPEYALRQRGKVAELALGYQGGVGAMRNMDVGNLLADLSDDEVQEIVNRWRSTNPKIRNMWYDFDSAAAEVIVNGGTVRVRDCVLAREYDCLRGTTCMTITLPSGRKLYYIDPAVGENRWGGSSLSYMGMDQTTKKWKRIETYGGKLVENCVQAIARDCLAQAIEYLEAAGLPVVFHVHDEVVIDVAPFGTDAEMLDKVVSIMTRPIPWAQGLPLGADGWVGRFFKKD